MCNCGLFINNVQLWTNTNKLLWSLEHQYLGIKTGITGAAGGCLVSMLNLRMSGKRIMVVILGSKNQSFRFIDTELLVAAFEQSNDVTRCAAAPSTLLVNTEIAS